MELHELTPGLHRWTAPHPEWKPRDDWDQDVGCASAQALLAMGGRGLWRGMPGSDEALTAYGDHDPALVEAAEPALTLCLAAWTLVIADRVGTEGATAEARRRVERALAYA